MLCNLNLFVVNASLPKLVFLNFIAQYGQKCPDVVKVRKFILDANIFFRNVEKNVRMLFIYS